MFLFWKGGGYESTLMVRVGTSTLFGSTLFVICVLCHTNILIADAFDLFVHS